MATATLSSSSSIFQIQPVNSAASERSLQQPSIVWEWTVQPKIVGSQQFIGSVRFQWKPTKHGKDEVYTIGYINFTVRVEANVTSSLPKEFFSSYISISVSIIISLLLILGFFFLLRWFLRKKHSKISTQRFSPFKEEITPVPRNPIPLHEENLISSLSEELLFTIYQAGTVKVFYSYASEDEKLYDELRKHLAILKRQKQIDEYDEIIPGTYWQREIEARFRTAHLILLLVSPDFMNSDYCYNIEMKYALNMHEIGKALTIPILLRPVVSWGKTPLADLQVLPTNGKPVSTWSHQEEAFANIAESIQRVLKVLQSEKLNKQKK